MSIEKHPQDFMVIHIGLEFRAMTSPESEDPPPLHGVEEWSACIPADESAADLLEEIAAAIRARRSYGYLQQVAAESAVACGEWIGKSLEIEEAIKFNGDANDNGKRK